MTTITFDSFSLNSEGVFTTETDIYSAPPITVNAETLAEADGAVIVKKRIEAKVFRCEGYLEASSIAELDNLIDSLKTALNKQDQNFDIEYGSSTRRYIATPRNIIISRPRGLNSAGWSAEFYCAKPVGSEIDAENLFASTNTTLSQATISFEVGGSYKAEPVITVTVNTLTDGTAKTITLSNASTLRGLSVTRTWTAGDVLEVDCLEKTVFVNNVPTEYTGQFPAWEPGNSGLSYLDDFTARDADAIATYTRRYI